jgi:hypothetical protein
LDDVNCNDLREDALMGPSASEDTLAFEHEQQSEQRDRRLLPARRH